MALLYPAVGPAVPIIADPGSPYVHTFCLQPVYSTGSSFTILHFYDSKDHEAEQLFCSLV